jgi:hypothetical protein
MRTIRKKDTQKMSLKFIAQFSYAHVGKYFWKSLFQFKNGFEESILRNFMSLRKSSNEAFELKEKRLFKIKRNFDSLELL